ncbi:hypothetical protein Sjap_002578 [Stephania japonica]|uniref:Integrase catalytic domain-containing protein n=1 Tax=Stephania japonica TaxID=461633 RepID=A0AAP0KM65_9MAGN
MESGSSSHEAEVSSTEFNSHRGNMMNPNAPFGNSLSQLITVKLTETNFLLWKATVIPLIEGHDLDGHLFGTTPCPTKSLEDGTMNPAYKSWFSRDRMLFGWLMTALTSDIGTSVVNPKNPLRTANELWTAIEAHCGTNNRSQIQVLKKQIQGTKKGSMRMNAYLLKMKSLADSLAIAGAPVGLEDLISNCLCGLDAEYLPMIAVLQRCSDLTWQEFQSSLMSFETTLDQLNVSQGINSLNLQDSTPTANAAETKNNGGRMGGNNAGGASQAQSSSNGQSRGFNNGVSSRGRGGRNRGKGGFRFSTVNKPTCQICGKFGHSAAVCYFRGDMKYMGSTQQQPPSQQPLRFTPTPPQTQTSFFGTAESVPDTSWYMDSGASSHITADPSQLNNCMPYGGNKSLMVGNGKYLPITSVGSTLLPSIHSRLSFHNTLCVPSIKKNLLSVSQLTRDNNVVIEFRPDVCLVKDIRTSEVLLHGHLHNGLYRFFGPSISPTDTHNAFLASNNAQSNLWHSRLGHPAHRVLSQVVHKHLNFSLSSVPDFCSYCPMGKIHALPYSNSNHIASHVLDLIHTDLWGPAPVTSTDGFNYYIHFIDDCTRFTWVYPLKLKSDAIHAFSAFKKLVENQFGTTIKRVQSDWGGEFRPFKPLLDSFGIIFQHSCPHTHEQNGRVERKHRHIIEMSLILLAQGHIPLKYWWDACETAIFLINRLPTTVLKGFSPYEKLFSIKPDYNILRVFGCACFPYMRPYNTHKYQFRSEKCVFLGYSSRHKGYKCLHPSRRVYISRNVLFNEHDFPYSSVFPNKASPPPAVPNWSSWVSLSLPTQPSSSTQLTDPTLSNHIETPSAPVLSESNLPSPIETPAEPVSGSHVTVPNTSDT